MPCCQTPGPHLKPATDVDFAPPVENPQGSLSRLSRNREPGLLHPC